MTLTHEGLIHQEKFPKNVMTPWLFSLKKKNKHN